jgi:hypothetical protein
LKKGVVVLKKENYLPMVKCGRVLVEVCAELREFVEVCAELRELVAVCSELRVLVEVCAE